MIVEALNTLPGFRCANPGGAFYAFPNIAGTGYDAKHVPDRAAGQGRGRDDRRHQLRRVRRGLYALLLCQQPRSNLTEAVDRIRDFLGNLPQQRCRLMR